MKKSLLFLLLAAAVMSFSGPKAAIDWTFTEHNFGKIDRNKPVTVEFTFKNPGMIPLVITNVKSSCGCTVPDYPKAPIAPGQTGTIVVTYDAKVSGYFSKTVTVMSNTSDGKSVLFIKGEVN